MYPFKGAGFPDGVVTQGLGSLQNPNPGFKDRHPYPIRRISEHASIKIVVYGKIAGVVSVDFSHVPLDEGVKRLIKGHTHTCPTEPRTCPSTTTHKGLCRGFFIIVKSACHLGLWNTKTQYQKEYDYGI